MLSHVLANESSSRIFSYINLNGFLSSLSRKNLFKLQDKIVVSSVKKYPTAPGDRNSSQVLVKSLNEIEKCAVVARQEDMCLVFAVESESRSWRNFDDGLFWRSCPGMARNEAIRAYMRYLQGRAIGE